LSNGEQIPVWAATMGADIASIKAKIDGIETDIGEIKQQMKDGSKNFKGIDERLICLETDKKSIGVMTKIVSWGAGVVASGLAILEALRTFK